MTNLLNRRAVVRALPFIAAVAAAPVILAEELRAALVVDRPDARLVELMAEWRVQIDIANSMYDDAAIEKATAIEREVVSILPTSAAGLAIKLLMLTAYGECDIQGTRNAECLYADAVKLCGFGPPPGYLTA